MFTWSFLFLTNKLQRFEHKSKASSKSSFSDKIEGRIDFPLSVNMLPYTTNPNSQRVDKSKYWYDLSSAVIHKGKLESGHYYAYCRQGDQVSIIPNANGSANRSSGSSSMTTRSPRSRRLRFSMPTPIYCFTICGLSLTLRIDLDAGHLDG